MLKAVLMLIPISLQACSISRLTSSSIRIFTIVWPIRTPPFFFPTSSIASCKANVNVLLYKDLLAQKYVSNRAISGGAKSFLRGKGILFQKVVQLAAQLSSVKAEHQLHLLAVAAQAVRRKGMQGLFVSSEERRVGTEYS